MTGADTWDWVQPQASRESKAEAPRPQLKEAGAEAAALEADFLASMHETRLWEAQLQDARDQVPLSCSCRCKASSAPDLVSPVHVRLRLPLPRI